MSTATPECLQALLAAQAVCPEDGANVALLLRWLGGLDERSLVVDLSRALQPHAELRSTSTLEERFVAALTDAGLREEVSVAKGVRASGGPGRRERILSEVVQGFGARLCALPVGVPPHTPALLASLAKAAHLIEQADWIAAADLRLAALAAQVAANTSAVVASPCPIGLSSSQFNTSSASVETLYGASRRRSPPAPGESP